MHFFLKKKNKVPNFKKKKSHQKTHVIVIDDKMMMLLIFPRIPNKHFKVGMLLKKRTRIIPPYQNKILIKI